MSKRIGFDVDGVIRDIYTPLIQEHKRIYPLKYIAPFNQWDYELEKNFQIGNEIYNLLDEPETSKSIYLNNALVYKHMASIINTLFENGNKIIIISRNASQNRLMLLMRFISKYRIYVDEYHIGHTPDFKQYVQCNVYFEDSPIEIMNYVNRGSPVFVPYRPWNNTLIKNSLIHMYGSTDMLLMEVTNCVNKLGDIL